MSSRDNDGRQFDGHVDRASRDSVNGWAFDGSEPDRPIDVIIKVDDRQVARICANELRNDLKQLGLYGDGCHGFTYQFSQPLDDEWDWRITVHFAENHEVLRAGEHPLRSIGEPSAGRAEKADHLSPLLVTSFGRAGSTLLMKLLLTHPNISVADTYPYEMRPASYFANAFRVLNAPQTTALPETTDTFDLSADHIYKNPFSHKEYGHVFPSRKGFESFFVEEAPAILRESIQEIVDRFYRNIRKKNGVDELIYFAEKCDISRQSRVSVRRMYGRAKEIILVRDLRDALCSHKKFFKRNPEADVIAHIANMGNLISAEKKKMHPDTIFIRYEDMILDRERTMHKIGDFLGVPSFWFFEAPDEGEMQTKHGTSQSAQASIGRWSEDLSPEEQEKCKIAFADFLRSFGYN